VHAGDAVADGQDRADLGQVRAALVEPLDAALEDAGDLVGLDLHLFSSVLSRRLWPLLGVGGPGGTAP
jgi:hypothetical protein